MYLKIGHKALANLFLDMKKCDFVNNLFFEFNYAISEKQKNSADVFFDLNSENSVLNIIEFLLKHAKSEYKNLLTFISSESDIYVKFDETNQDELEKLKNLILGLKLLQLFMHFKKTNIKYDLIEIYCAVSETPAYSVYENVIPHLKMLLLFFKDTDFDILAKKGILKKYKLKHISTSTLSLFVPKTFARNPVYIIKALMNDGIDLPEAKDIMSAIKNCKYDFDKMAELFSLSKQFDVSFDVEDFECRLKNMHEARSWLKNTKYKLFNDNVTIEEIGEMELCYNYDYFAEKHLIVVKIIKEEDIEYFVIDKNTGKAKELLSDEKCIEGKDLTFKIMSKEDLNEYINQEMLKLKTLKSKWN